MRPIQLVMSAFGPYGGEQVVDFRKLGERSFFLIHGPTGGGKTTILDALCYALYGDTSGHERTGEQMRSHLAQPGMPTSVTFDFALGEKAYRVTRSPEQERPKKRGEGTTLDGPKAVLWDRTGLADDAQEGTVLAAQPMKVIEQVEGLLGFRSEQFRQVIILPQDKFRELLMADSVKREEILQALFQTEFYELIQDSLKARAKEVEQKVKEIRQRQFLLLQQAQAASLSELRERRSSKAGDATALETTITQLRGAEAGAQAKLTDAFQIEAKLNEQEQAVTALRQLDAKAQEYNQKRQAIDAARRAALLAPDEDALLQRQREVTTRQGQLAAAQADLSVAQLASETASRTLKAWAELQPEMSQLHDEIARLNNLGEQVERLEQAQRELVLAEKRIEAAKTRQRSAQAALGELQIRLDGKRNQLASAQQVAAEHDGHVLAVELATTQLQDRRKLESIRGKLPGQEQGHAELAGRVAFGSATLQRQRAELARLHEAWSNGQAAILAQGLVAGQPCPVCGSQEHPQPATSIATLPSKEQIDQKQRDIDAQEKCLDGVGKQLQATATELATAKANESALATALGAWAEKQVAALEAQLKARKVALNAAQTAKDGVAPLVNTIAKTDMALRDQKTALDLLNGEFQTAADTVTSQRALRDENLQGVPEGLRTQAALIAAKTAAAARLKQIDEGVATARTAATEAEKTFAAASAEYGRAKTEADEAAGRLLADRQEFEGKREQAGFTSDAAYRAARLADVQIRQIEEQVQQYDQALSAARDRTRRAAGAADGLTAPDMAALRNALAVVKDKLEPAIRASGNLAREIEQIDKWTTELGDAESQREQAEKDYAVVGYVAGVASGQNGAGLAFQRFVLTFLLDDVLVAATERLRIMSKGRYQLQRLRERTDHRVQSGLDLEVFDTYTGTARQAATLSGGESFLASLSLALGLADVVQTYAGGMRLETMFIDEGFGSLDSEALDLAIRSLIDLLKDGRLVGIISHVPELRERIDARLEVTFGRSGATAQFVLS